MSKSSFRRFKMSLQILRSSNSYSRRRMIPKMEQSYDYNRKWMLAPNYGTSSCPRIKLLSYNILAQDLLMEHLFLYVNIKQEWLTWQRRLHNLQREITKLNPDILCLQEMQNDHLPMLVQGLTASSGKRLEYIYKKKTGSRTDGCAIIYDSSKFKLVCQEGVELYDTSVPLLNRGNVALLAKFQLKQQSPQEPHEEPKEVIIATTHLLYNPNRDDVRCAQVSKLLTELNRFAKDQPLSLGTATTPVILTGDFNSQINTSPIELLTSKDTEASALNLELLHCGDCTASTFQEDWITVDYILRSVSPLSKHQLQVLSVYKLPTIDCLAEVGNIPSHYLGSDHYALGAIFALN